MRLQIVTPGPSQGSLHVYLAAMTKSLIENGFEPPGIQNPMGSDLVAVRTAGLRAALEQDPTHVLWIDSDMTFPPTLAQRLYQHDKDVVACNVVLKDFSGRHYATNAHIPDPSGASQVSSVGKYGLETIRRIGMGIMMTRADVYYRISFPWFGHKWYHTERSKWYYSPFPSCIKIPSRHYLSMIDGWRTSFEDWWFCERLEEAGIQRWIDHTLSVEIGHRGSCVFYSAGAGLG